MTKKRRTRRALINSVISLLICFSMLLGTTFAWFTDEVTTGMNTIQAGNLDVELMAGTTKVDSNTKLFDDVALWEPGAVVYENLQVVNAGTLALKYQMTLNFGNENNLNGHKLSEVLKVAVIDKIADNAKREDVLAAAKAAPAKDKGTLSNFCQNGTLLPSESSNAQTVVIFWEPNENEIDNLYNANNGQTTSDGQPLHIEFGVNLQSTQKMYEEDSFGPDYDKDAEVLPKAAVNNTGAKSVTARPYSSFNDAGSAIELKLDTTFQFLPNETKEEAEVSAYRYWHADYVVSADKDVAGNSMALAGYYKLFADFINSEDWIYLSGEKVDAGDQVRLLEAMGAFVNYEELCNFGNDGTGFLCGASDLDGSNVGTTLKVELRLYETYPEGECPEDHGGHSSKNCETGNYEVVGTYSYTFGPTSAESLLSALNSGVENVVLSSDIQLNDAPLTIADDVVLNLNGHTISGISTSNTTSSLIKVNAGAELTLTGDGAITFGATTPDTNWGGEGQPAFPGYANNTISNLGKLVIDGVTIKNVTAPGGASYAIDCYQGSELIVNSGVIDGMGKVAIRMFANSKTESTNVTINGGTITGRRAIWVQLPGSDSANVPPVKLTITGGKLISTDASDCCIYSYSYGNSFAGTNVTISGGEFTGRVAFGGGKKTTKEIVTITGGTFNDGVGRYLENDVWEDITVPTV